MPRVKFKAIVPDHIPKTDDYMHAILGAYNKTINLIEHDLNNTKRTWNHKVDFRTVQTAGTKHLTTTIGTDDKIYGFVNSGTKPHVIMPKRSKYLRFSSGYRAKTRVGIIGSQEGGSFGEDRFAAKVQHPGFPGRKFTAIIKKRRQVTMNQEISHAIAVVNRTQK